ncbi:YdcF family protein [Yinghuangia soli]|uniref:YdcF family protein n=1 Tax=Yinghuangia soli TaxID=2908204 RepID=A0AA41Q7C8_9ACTN|nr:YdcF family protein [Yinghuangia soli]MCF2532056.1 YdcF family protein [Yinghuangia soli]
MIPYCIALFFFALFCWSVYRDRRRFRNAVYLGLAVCFLGLGVLDDLSKGPVESFEVVLAAVLLLPVLGTLLLGGFLIANGVKMVRKEGRGPANFLSLLAGLGLIAFIVLMATAVHTESRWLGIVAGTSLLLVGYVSFLFLCFIGYAFLYGRMPVRGDVDYVVVLGSGLIGSRVPPLLASRLDRGRAVYDAQAARGNPPVMLMSGGQGPDEEVAESVAMADYLTDRGVPAAHVEREQRSRTTEENMRFSKEIMQSAAPGSRCVIVTNNFHAFRAAMMARKVGVDGQVVGSPTAAYFWPSATIREFAAVFLAHPVINLGICLLLIATGTSALWDR